MNIEKKRLQETTYQYINMTNIQRLQNSAANSEDATTTLSDSHFASIERKNNFL